MATFKSPDELMKAIQADILKDASDLIVGKDPKELGQILKNNYTAETLTQYADLEVNGDLKPSKTTKYSKHWFAKSDGSLGHLFKNDVGVGINNSEGQSGRNIQFERTYSEIYPKKNDPIETAIYSARQAMTTMISGNVGRRIAEVKESENKLMNLARKIADKMKYMVNAKSYSYITKVEQRERFNIKDIILYKDSSPEKIKDFVDMNVITTKKAPGSQNFRYYFRIKDPNFLEFLFKYQVAFDTWQAAFVANQLGIIVHEEASDVYRLKMHD